MLGGLTDPWHALCFKSAATWMGCVVVTRMARPRVMFRHGFVVLGTGARLRYA